jgi:hypothetical protein
VQLLLAVLVTAVGLASASFDLLQSWWHEPRTRQRSRTTAALAMLALVVGLAAVAFALIH